MPKQQRSPEELFNTYVQCAQTSLSSFNFDEFTAIKTTGKTPYQSDLSYQIGLPQAGGGNTCYIHSAVQAISAISGIEDFLKEKIQAFNRGVAQNKIKELDKRLNRLKEDFEKDASQKLISDIADLYKKINQELLFYTSIHLILWIKEHQKGNQNAQNQIGKLWPKFVKEYRHGFKSPPQYAWQDDTEEVIGHLLDLLQVKNPVFTEERRIYLASEQDDLPVVEATVSEDSRQEWYQSPLKWYPSLELKDLIEKTQSQVTDEKNLGNHPRNTAIKVPMELKAFTRTQETKAPPEFLNIILPHQYHEGRFQRAKYNIPLEQNLSITSINDAMFVATDYVLSSVCAKAGGQGGGHYIQYFRKGNHWFSANDDQITQLKNGPKGEYPEELELVLSNQHLFFPRDVIYARKDCFADEHGLQPQDLKVFTKPTIVKHPIITVKKPAPQRPAYKPPAPLARPIKTLVYQLEKGHTSLGNDYLLFQYFDFTNKRHWHAMLGDIYLRLAECPSEPLIVYLNVDNHEADFKKERNAFKKFLRTQLSHVSPSVSIRFEKKSKLYNKEEWVFGHNASFTQRWLIPICAVVSILGVIAATAASFGLLGIPFASLLVGTAIFGAANVPLIGALIAKKISSPDPIHQQQKLAAIKKEVQRQKTNLSPSDAFSAYNALDNAPPIQYDDKIIVPYRAAEEAYQALGYVRRSTPALQS